MKLKILLPEKIFLQKEVVKVIAESKNGSFCLLPNHIDFVTVLAPGIFIYEFREKDKKKEEFLALDEGVLVKRGKEIFVSARNAARSEDLGKLKETVEKQFKMLDEKEKKARTTIAKFEADFARRFLELES